MPQRGSNSQQRNSSTRSGDPTERTFLTPAALSRNAYTQEHRSSHDRVSPARLRLASPYRPHASA